MGVYWLSYRENGKIQIIIGCVYIDIYISWGLLVGNEGIYSIGIRKGLYS